MTRGKRVTRPLQGHARLDDNTPAQFGAAATSVSGGDRISNATSGDVTAPAIGDLWAVENPAGTVELRYKCADGTVRTIHTYVYA